MKARFVIAALLLMAFGSVRAQDTITVVKMKSGTNKMDTLRFITPNMAELPDLMQELGVYLQHLNDSVDWKTFEEDMEKWGKEMEEWGRKMERWGGQFEGQTGAPKPQPLSRSDVDQVRAIQLEGSGDVYITQSPNQFTLQRSDNMTTGYYITNGTLVLSGSSEYEVDMPQLEEVILRSSGSIIGRGVIHGRTLRIYVKGSGDVDLDVDYDTVIVEMHGSGDVTLNGQCNAIYANISGSGDLQISGLRYAESQISATGSGEVLTNDTRSVIHQTNKEEKRPEKKSPLLDAHWNGFEAGLNMLFDAPREMDLRSLRCWYFGFNIADVGIAFDRKHIAGLFTGVGLGWNNFSWNNPITVEYDYDNAVYTIEPIETDQVVKNTKYGVLFAQVPLMFEFRPTRHMYIDAGVTGGLRIAQWNRVKLEDGTQSKRYYGADINRFKLDASLRVGGENMGFFANYALLPLYTMGNAEVHPVSFGFSVNF